MDLKNLSDQQRTAYVFAYIMEGVKAGAIKPMVCAKSTWVDAHFVTAEEAGQEHIVWSQGKVEKVVILQEGMVLITTLDENGNPILDSDGHTNTYDMSATKFAKNYTLEIDGHYVKDPYDKGSVMVAVELPAELVGEGLTILPPNWGGYSGTLMPGGYIMLPYKSGSSLLGQVYEWEQVGVAALDFYPNNEPQTYSECDKNGTFRDPALRKRFEQNQEYQGEAFGSRDKTTSD